MTQTNIKYFDVLGISTLPTTELIDIPFEPVDYETDINSFSKEMLDNYISKSFMAVARVRTLIHDDISKHIDLMLPTYLLELEHQTEEFNLFVVNFDRREKFTSINKQLTLRLIDHNMVSMGKINTHLKEGTNKNTINLSRYPLRFYTNKSEIKINHHHYNITNKYTGDLYST